ncbi:MAG: hypothetical protein HY736_11575 [Verrucomicrobia bacterium]|nr:hypothetical protein [Verrucomicrobiota bacterium]
MTRLPRVPLFVISAVFVAGTVAAAEPLRAAKPPDPAAVPLPRPRLVSTDAADRLAASAPKYEPPSPVAKVETQPDRRETDKPRNVIVRLPPYVVQGSKPPIFKERELLTPQGRLDLALKRHPGLRFGSFWFLRNDGWGLAMLEEEQRLERNAEFNDLVGLMTITDPKAGGAAKKESQPTLLRRDGL